MESAGHVPGRPTILITGGAGAIGVNLAREAVARGAREVVLLDRSAREGSWRLPEGDGIVVVRGDIRDDRALDEAFGHRPQLVFHLAAHFANLRSVEQPEENLDVNGRGTLKVFEKCRQAGVERVIYASSGCGIYGPGCTAPFTEEQVSIDLGTPYQITKLLGELYCNYYHRQFNLPVSRARLFNVYGPGEIPGRYRNVIPNFLYLAMQGRPLTITGDGSETRDWTFVDDAVDGLLAVAATPDAVGEAINICSGIETPVGEMAKIVNRLTGNPAGIEKSPRRSWDIKPALLGSHKKATELLGWKPGTEFLDGITTTHQWFVDNWSSIKTDATF